MKPKHLDLFSGIGGFALAARWTGFDTIGFAEIDSYACRVLRKHWPTVPNYGDIGNVPTIECELVTGGFPCQPFSIAGRRLGTMDDRNLWPAMLDVVRRCRPTWVLGENVANISNMVLSDVQDDLAAIGYQSVAFDIPACAAGLSTMERHVWIVATRGGVELEGCGKERLPAISGLESQFSEWGQTDNEIERNLRVPNLPDARTLRSRKGVSNFVDRIRGIGNAINPQVAARIMRLMI